MEPVSLVTSQTVAPSTASTNSSVADAGPASVRQNSNLAAIEQVAATTTEQEQPEQGSESVTVSTSLGQSSEAGQLTRSNAIELYRRVAALV
ncbi:hypothetical protein ACFSJ3_11465 [Corallincola platygyrae]|uniref:Uncharacterized protein n=1 Tax=Corallincola platygyrae TaxID=1193278 RepID=A0ABW4XNA8_9GAMM